MKLCGTWLEPKIKSHQCGLGKFHKSRTKGLNQVELSPNPTTTRRFRTQLNLRSNMGLKSNVPEQQKPEPSQSQAGRPRRGRSAPNCRRWSYATATDLRRRSRASLQRRRPHGHIPRPAGLGEAGRPHLATSEAPPEVGNGCIASTMIVRGRPAWLWLGSSSCCTDLLFSRPTLLHKLNWALVLRFVTGFDFNSTWFKPFGLIL